MENLEAELKKLHKLTNLDDYAFSNRDINDSNEWHFKAGAQWAFKQSEQKCPSDEQLASVFQKIIDRDIVHLDEFVKAVRGRYPSDEEIVEYLESQDIQVNSNRVIPVTGGYLLQLFKEFPKVGENANDNK